jgi:hypothetical protein
MRYAGLRAVVNSYRKNSFIRFVFVAVLLCLIGLATSCATPSNAAANSTPAPAQLKLSTPYGAASVGMAYNAVSAVSGGSAPYSFRISSGNLPPGLVLNSATGSISGVPSAAGLYNFVVSVSDPAQQLSGSGPAEIVVSDVGRTWISISPSNVTVTSQGSQQFTATVSGSANTAVIWSASAGTISSTGNFLAPEVSTNTMVTIDAASIINPRLQASAAVTITPPTPLAIDDEPLPAAKTAVPYVASLSATGGEEPYQWNISAGSLPSGIQLQPASGEISGTTTTPGSFPFTAKVTDATGQSSTLALVLTVSSGSTSGYDGPAELPRVYIQTAMADTPAPGNVTTVNAGGDLQSALNNANCGDTIQLQAGATFTGVFTFPAKSCDDDHWIILRTSSPDSALPQEGSRLTPCYAGVASLPGRPAFNCTSTMNVLARLVMAASGSGPVVFAPGANHYRLLGLELTRTAGTGIVYALASINATGGTANNIILDRMWIHGTPQDETKRGLEVGGMSYASAIDSFFTDMKCISVSGACTDAAAIAGGSGNPLGPFKIVDNFLEASGENILLGGASSTTTPADIQISQNHFFKPKIWMKGQPGYVGAANGNPFIVKNLFELKNAQRVLLEANIMEYSWGGFSQNGYAILITPTNQVSGTGMNLCPICLVTDVTIRYNTISHVGSGLQIANVLSGNGPPLDGERYSIHDITIDDIDPVTYSGSGNDAEILWSPPAPLLQNVLLNHITSFAPTEMFSVGGAVSPKMVNVNFTNSIYLAGEYPVWSTGGVMTCANYDKPLTTFNACFGPYEFVDNAVIATPSAYPASEWPTENYFPATVASVQFVNYNNGNGGNYQLLSTSPYHNAGTDGKDLGADVSTILSETAGVY